MSSLLDYIASLLAPPAQAALDPSQVQGPQLPQSQWTAQAIAGPTYPQGLFDRLRGAKAPPTRDSSGNLIDPWGGRLDTPDPYAEHFTTNPGVFNIGDDSPNNGPLRLKNWNLFSGSQ